MTFLEQFVGLILITAIMDYSCGLCINCFNDLCVCVCVCVCIYVFIFIAILMIIIKIAISEILKSGRITEKLS